MSIYVVVYSYKDGCGFAQTGKAAYYIIVGTFILLYLRVFFDDLVEDSFTVFRLSFLKINVNFVKFKSPSVIKCD